tara:strand:+ start:245 stop:874 length:630 start_codon:yes stop_codon:yes gene_type:complete
MKLWKFKDYEEYKAAQIVGYTAKFNTHSWVDTNGIRGLVSYIKDYNPDVSFGICHGTRRGVEQEEFNNTFEAIDMNVNVIGTEIAKDAETRFKNTIEWDFHEVKDDWSGNVDFIYSNSFDHSYDPEKALDSWMECLNDKGLCFIEWSGDSNAPARPMDPYQATYEEYKELFESKFEVVDILQNEPEKDEGKNFRGERFYFVIRNKNEEN